MRHNTQMIMAIYVVLYYRSSCSGTFAHKAEGVRVQSAGRGNAESTSIYFLAMIRRKVAERRSRKRHTWSDAETEGTEEVSGGLDQSEEEMEDEEEVPKKKPVPWRQQTSNEVYEQQLEKLNDQLVATMLEKQALEGQLAS